MLVLVRVLFLVLVLGFFSVSIMANAKQRLVFFRVFHLLDFRFFHLVCS